MTNVVRKQLQAIRKIAVKNMGANPTHFKALISEIDLALADDEADRIAYIENLEYVEECDFDMREIA